MPRPADFHRRTGLDELGRRVDAQVVGGQSQRGAGSRCWPGDHHVAIELHVIAIRAHLPPVGLEMPHFTGRLVRRLLARNFGLGAGVVIHGQIFQVDHAALGLLADDFRGQSITFAPVIPGFDDFRVEGRITGIGQRGGRGFGRIAFAPGAADEIGAGDDDNGEAISEWPRPSLHARSRLASSSQSQTSRTAPWPPARVVTRSAAASASACASATAIATPAACRIGASGVSSPTQAQCSKPIERALASLVKAASLSLAPWVTCRMPSSRARRATAADLRPERMATVMPAAATCLMPWPSRTWKVLSDSPRAP